MGSASDGGGHCEAKMRVMQLELRHIAAFDAAEQWMFHSDFCPYLELKHLLNDESSLGRDKFRALFSRFYGFNAAGITDEFQEKFFEILGDGKRFLAGEPDYRDILERLSKIKRKKGDLMLPLSFVSKLVAMRCESRPIYDRHVLAFFRQRPPPASVEMAKRIEWYLEFLDYVAHSYKAWEENAIVAEILERLRGRDKQLGSCHVIRLMDFLVWKVGRQRLLEKQL